MSGRRDLLVEQPIFAQIAAPNTDADAYLAVHPGAAAFYNGTQQSFMDDRLGAEAAPTGAEPAKRAARSDLRMLAAAAASMSSARADDRFVDIAR